ncbi:MAG: hypothetical protein ACYDAY_09390 [Candidatus Dormibacteria bacterium]
MKARSRTNPAGPVAIALALVYVAVMNGHLQTVDGLHAYYQARALAFAHSLRFPVPLQWVGITWNSKYGIGLSMLYVPLMWVFSFLLPGTPLSYGARVDPARLYADPLYTAAAAPVHIVVTALAVWLVARMLGEVGLDRRLVLWGAVLFGLASPALIYARGDWGQPTEGLCWIAAVYCAWRARQRGHARRLHLCLMALAVLFAVLTRPVEGLVLMPAMVAVTLLRLPTARRDLAAAAIALAVLGAGFAADLLVNWARWGSAFDFGYREGWFTPLWVGVPGLALSPGRGLLFAFPAVILLPLGARRLWRAHRALTMSLLVLVVLQFLNVAAWEKWWGGGCFGPRLFVPALPALGVLCAVGLPIGQMGRPWSRVWRGAVPWLLLAGGLAFSLPAVLTDTNGRYAAAHDSSASSFPLAAHPALGAWPYFDHVFATRVIDPGALDILWFRLAGTSGPWALLPFAAALALAGALLAWLAANTRQGPITGRAA